MLKNPEAGTADIPLIIGVTGHRDLPAEDLPALRAALADLFSDLRRQYPHTPLRLLSPLAEGADRLAAEVGLESGIELVVPLPMPLEEYTRDFPDSRPAFNQLLDRASAVFELPWIAGNSASGTPNRAAQYAAVGAFIVQHSQILIALWDGQQTDRMGGTAAVVTYKLNGIPELFAAPPSPLDDVDTGPVFHILTRRISNLTVNGTPGTRHILTPHDKRIDTYHHVWRRIDDFNAHAHEINREQPDAVEQSTHWLHAPHLDLTTEETRMARVFAAADVLSAGYKRRAVRLLQWLFLLAFFMVLVADTWSHFATAHISILFAYPVLFCLAVLVSRRHRQQDRMYHDRFLDYRALAEAIRVQLYWRVAGLEEQAADHYLRKQGDRLRWIRESLRALNVVPALPGARTGLALRYWIQDQAVWYAKSAHRDTHKSHRAERTGRLLFAGGLVASVLLALILTTPALQQRMESLPLLHAFLVIMLGVLPATTALLTGYAEKMAWSEQARQYTRMAAIFREAGNRFAQLTKTDPDRLHPLLVDLGREALIENADWVLLHHERTIEPIKG